MNFLKTVDYEFIEECVDKAVTRVFLGDEVVENAQPDLLANYTGAATNYANMEQALLDGLETTHDSEPSFSSTCKTEEPELRRTVDALAHEVWYIKQCLREKGLLSSRSPSRDSWSGSDWSCSVEGDCAVL